jgi:hypothetical protein
MEYLTNFKKLSKKEQDILVNWCKAIGKRKTINPNMTSYGLKHVFERSEVGFYIDNDTFKEAMFIAGFKREHTLINCCFNYSEKGLKEIIRNDKNLRKYYKHLV